MNKFCYNCKLSRSTRELIVFILRLQKVICYMGLHGWVVLEVRTFTTGIARLNQMVNLKSMNVDWRFILDLKTI